MVFSMGLFAFLFGVGILPIAIPISLLLWLAGFVYIAVIMVLGPQG